MISVQAKLTGDKKIARRLDRLKAQTGNLRPVMRDIADSLETSTRERFINETDPSGKKWERHSTATEQVRGIGADKLRDRNHLYDSITSSSGDDKIGVGSNLIYARIQQLGGEAGRKSKRVKIPARPYLGINRADRAEILGALKEHINEEGLEG